MRTKILVLLLSCLLLGLAGCQQRNHIDEESERQEAADSLLYSFSALIYDNSLPSGLVEGVTLDFQLQLPSDWIANEEQNQFLDSDGQSCAAGFYAYRLSKDSLWEDARPDLSPGYLSSESVNLNGQELLLAVFELPSGKNEKAPPKEEAICSYHYFIPYETYYLNISFHAKGSNNSDAKAQQQSILQSLHFEGISQS